MINKFSTGFTAIFASEMLLTKLGVSFQRAYEPIDELPYLRAYVVNKSAWNILESYYFDDPEFEHRKDQLPVLVKTDELLLSFGKWDWSIK